MIILGRLFRVVFLILFAGAILSASVEGASGQATLNGLSKIQNTMEEVAHENGMNIHVEWSIGKHQGATATVIYNGMSEAVTFSNSELKNANEDHILTDTLDKIHKMLSQFPGGSEPPGEQAK